MPKITAHDVAKYFLTLVEEDAGDLISNLKLQKLIYYAQGFHLAIFDKPLFGDPIEAWDHGPVVDSLYQEYKCFGADKIPVPGEVDFSIYDDQTTELLNEVWDVFGQFSAWKLRNMTHEESPWKDTGRGLIIPHDPMKEYFKTQIKN